MKNEKIIQYTFDELDQKKERGEFPATDWKRLETMSDEELEKSIQDDPDSNPSMSPEHWAAGRLVTRKKVNKVPISIRIDPEVLSWYKAKGHGYQTLMVDVLRTYANAHDKT